MNIADILSISVIFLYCIPILSIGVLYLLNGSITMYYPHIIAFTGLLGTVGISESIKYGIMGNSNPRPFGATNCNLWCNDGNQEGNPGMPSSHAAIVAFFIGFYYPYITRSFVKVGLIIYGVSIIISRYVKHCHTVEQLIVGAILGTILSIVARYMVRPF